MFNTNIMINYLKNGNNIKNINNSNNKHIKNESNYLYFNNEYSKDLIIKKNRVNIFEEHSKLINCRKLLNTKKNKEESSKHNTFDLDTKNEKVTNINYNNNNMNNINNNDITNNNKKQEISNNNKICPLNEDLKIITNENGINKREEKNKTLINFNYRKNKNKDTKYIKCKKDIFEKMSKRIMGDKLFGKKNDLVLKKIKLTEDKNNRNSNNKIKKKAKSQVETENNIQKLEEKLNDKIKEKNNTEMNKVIDSNKKEKIIGDNMKKNDKENINININLNINEQNIEKKEKAQNILDKNNKIDEYNENINEENENDALNNNQDNIEKEEMINTENESENKNIIEEENIIDNKTENEDNIKNENDEKIKIQNKEDKIDIGIETSIINDINLNNINTNKSIDYNEEEEEESQLSYFDIKNIKEDIQIPKEYINIIYRNLLIEEEKGVKPLPCYNKILEQKEINKQMRSILVDWIIDVHYKFGFSDETLFMTVLIIDRYLSVKQISKIRFQLLGITAMLIACKHEEINLPKIDDFIYITDNAYTKDEVYIMENDILNIFNFELLYPSPIKFYECLSLKFNFDKKKFLMGKYLMESFLVDLGWVKYRPSVISCSCVYIVMKFYKMDNYQEAYNKKYYNLDENDSNNPKYNNEYDIKECSKDICFYVDNVNKTNYLSCKNKYSNEKNEKIALIIEG